MSTAPARLVEKALCEMLALAVPGKRFLPQKGDDNDPAPAPGAPVPPQEELEMPYNVFGVVPDTFIELIKDSGVYTGQVKLIMLSDMSCPVQEHEGTILDCWDALKRLALPQGWIDDVDPADFITISGIDIMGPPVDITDTESQANCDVISMAFSASTRPLKQTFIGPNPGFDDMPNIFSAPMLLAGNLAQGQTFGYYVLPGAALLTGFSLALQSPDPGAGFTVEIDDANGNIVRQDCTLATAAATGTNYVVFSSGIALTAGAVLRAKLTSYAPSANGPAQSLALALAFQGLP